MSSGACATYVSLEAAIVAYHSATAFLSHVHSKVSNREFWEILEPECELVLW